ncbi:sensor histidine kinase [Dictyobacter arantiisoli]|uniref:Cache domain-containing protein n=1 Tax=Dictyobacter arantiisoli TaxID=2014874 RepID=A0A5A5TJ82_9CHLR|nr:cache domain-containing protein [Dictyobacter arantiisoli]GCF11477.1 hypothetical protein KDI_50410 [Dictyobacter arantiisoli]
MALSKSKPVSRKGITLTVKVSGLLVLAVIIPLLITVVGSELILRPTLVSQATNEMSTDAQNHMSAIDSLVIARLQDLDYISQYSAIQKYLAGDINYRDVALDELQRGHDLDANYGNWTLFAPNGSTIKLTYPTLGSATRGKSVIPADIQQQLRQGTHKTIISDIYFDNQARQPFVDMYTTIISPGSRLLGIGRATFKLNDVWTAVNNETNATKDSFAMVLDENGIRIAYTNPDTTGTTLPAPLFQSVRAISPALHQKITNENLYGNTGMGSVKTLADANLENALHDPAQTSSFSYQPPLQTQTFEAFMYKSHVLPWAFVSLRPLSSITSPATQQDFYLVIIAVVVTFIAAVVGLWLGQTITRPILQSASLLSGSSDMLNTLAAREQVTATEQKWIVESSQTALQSVQYYTEATTIAVRKLDQVGNALREDLQRNNRELALQHLSDIIEAARYLDKVATHQDRSSQSLTTAIRIASQVTEQLISGATSATDAATQLQEVIKQLRQVVGN